MADIFGAGAFSFRERPTPVPGDLRIRWRVCLLLLLLDGSRARKASLAKLYVMSDAVQSPQSLKKLQNIIEGGAPVLSWRLRVEPALARALDLMVGDGLASWVRISDRIGVALTPRGETAALAVRDRDDVLAMEREALSAIRAGVTETFVSRVVSARG